MAKKKPFFGVSNYVKSERQKKDRSTGSHAKKYSKRIPRRKAFFSLCYRRFYIWAFNV